MYIQVEHGCRDYKGDFILFIYKVWGEKKS